MILLSEGGFLMASNSGKLAIIGLSGSFPGASDVSTFWKRLCRGESLVRFLPPKVSEDESKSAAISPGRHVPAVSCMDGIDLFDAEFFGITPSEAEITDPQHRVLLEHSWHAMEDAGYNSRRYAGAVGVFAGATTNTYLLQNIASHSDLMRRLAPVQLNIANGADFLTTRISYKLNLHGPSHAVQCACSSSLVAVHCACRSLLDFECEMALAGGVSINVTLLDGYQYQEGGIQSPDGICRPFDAEAGGTIFGSGVGVVVLKRLEDALADGDSIRAVILGSAVNNDGTEKVGFTAPSVEGQARAIIEALSNADVEPQTVTYVECHGTGTALGDPVEVRALSKAFGEGRGGKCGLGSVKSNVGHLDAAAGVTGLIKVVMSLEHRMLAPSLHYRVPNPEIDFAGTPVYVNTELRRWERGETPLRAGVSAFGVGGTNAHVVVEEAPAQEGGAAKQEWQLLVLSGRTEKALQEGMQRLAKHLGEHEEQKLADVAYTLQVGRQCFAYRHTVVSRSREEAMVQLEQGRDGQGEAGEKGPAVVFLFPGQGSQQMGMGWELYRSEGVYRRSVEECSEILRPHLGLDLREYLNEGEGAEGKAEEMEETWLAQPALVTVEYGLSQLWKSWGVEPEAMLGHSLGEYTAAIVAGVMSLEEGLRLVAERGRLMQATAPGGMLAISLAAGQVEKWLGGGLTVAAINGAELCTVSGGKEAIRELEWELREHGVNCQRLRTSHGFHSAMVEPALERYGDEVRKVKLRVPKIPFVSNVSGTWIGEQEAQTAEYWVRQMRAPVRFDEGLQTVLREGGRVLLEVGPGQTLRRIAMRHREARRARLLLATLPGDGRGSQVQGLLTTVGRLWEEGAEIDWAGFHAGERRRRIPLPTYPLQRRRFWISPISQLPISASSEPPQLTPEENKTPIEKTSTRPLLRNPYVPPIESTEKVIVSILEQALGIHPIGVMDKFGELGGDSLAAVRIVAQINSALHSELRVIDLYEGLTPREVAARVPQSLSGTETPMESSNSLESHNEIRRDQYLRKRRQTRQSLEN